MSGRSRASRLAAVALGASLGVIGLVLPATAAPSSGDQGNHLDAAASADPQATDGQVTGHYAGTAERGYSVNIKAGDGTNYTGVIAELMKLRTSTHQSLEMYCIELTVNLQPKATLVKQPWDQYPGAGPFSDNSGEINWVLHHSYPSLSAAQLAKATGINGLTSTEAITATQAAIWKYSDNAKFNLQDPLTGKHAAAHAADVVKLYQYLTGSANTGDSNQPGIGLSLTPSTVSGHSGSDLGPVTVNTNAAAGNVQLTSDLPSGVTLVDKDGKPLDAKSVMDGSQIYFHVPSDAKSGKASFTATAEASLPVGWLFVGEHYKKQPTQSLIVAHSTPTKQSASASANWTPVVTTTTPSTPTTSAVVVPPTTAPPTTTPPVNNTANKSGLAYTGVSIALPVGIAVLLLLGGGALLLIQRKRKRA